MTPKFRGIAERLKKLQHNLNADAESLDARINAAEQKSKNVFAKSNASIDGAHRSLDEVDHFLNELEKSNGPPSDSDSESGSHELPRSSTIAARG